MFLKNWHDISNIFRLNLFTMSPKRLFHIPSMTTVMYKDNTDDIKKDMLLSLMRVLTNVFC